MGNKIYNMMALNLPNHQLNHDIVENPKADFNRSRI